ncbi:MAG: FG-GAP-like repeat-containing protein [Bacillota bacterium]
MAQDSDYTYSWCGYHLGGSMQVATAASGGVCPEILASTSGGRLYSFTYEQGGYQRREALPLEHIAQHMASGDTDGDGQDELVMAGDNTLHVYRKNQGSYRKQWQSSDLGGRISGLAVKDINGDGVQEIVCVIEGQGVKAFHWDGNTFSPIWQQAGGTLVVVGDVDGDGRAEIGVLAHAGDASRGSVYALANQGTREWQGNLAQPAEGPTAAGDVNNDGREEIVAATEGGRRIVILDGNRGSFIRLAISDALPEGIVSIVIADVDQDRVREIIIATRSHVIIFRFSNRRLVIVRQVEIPQDVVSLVVVDANGDGRLEIIVGTVAGVVVIVLPFFRAVTQFMVQQDLVVPANFPDILEVAQVKVTRKCVNDVVVIPGKVIIKGEFEVSVLIIAAPDRRVMEFSGTIPFVHFIRVPDAVRRKVATDVEVEFATTHFDPANPREVEVVIIAKVIAFDFVVGHGDTFVDIAIKNGVTVSELLDVNGLSGEAVPYAGQKLKIPPR